MNTVVDLIPTIIVGAIFLALTGIAIAVMIRNRKSGRFSCGGSCMGCPMSGKCNKK